MPEFKAVYQKLPHFGCDLQIQPLSLSKRTKKKTTPIVFLARKQCACNDFPREWFVLICPAHVCIMFCIGQCLNNMIYTDTFR